MSTPPSLSRCGGRVDIVTVVSHESREDLDRFGEALGHAWRRLGPQRQGQMILVENASDDSLLGHAARTLSGAGGRPPETLRHDRRGGPARAYNHGFLAVESPYVALFDPDGAPDEETLVRLLEALDTHEGAALAAAEVMPFAAEPSSPQAPAEVEWASAGATVYRMEAVRALGGFDELFAYTCEEMDFGYRARKAGWTCLRVPGATFRHEVGHRQTWLRTLRYLEYLMVWRHIHFSRTVAAKSWLKQLPQLVALGRRAGWRAAGGGFLGLFAYFRHIPACERRR